MQSNLELMQEKLAALEKALILETDAAVKFKLTQEIAELEKLKEKIKKYPKDYVFNVPIPRNPCFTGRGDILAKLHEILQSKNELTIRPSEKATALSGLGGVGKNQTVAEYAHRYQSKYSAVLWVLADGRDLLRNSFAQLFI